MLEGRLVRMRKIEFELLNRRDVIIVESPKGFRLAVVRIAEPLVGRVDFKLGEGDEVKVGQRIGMVKLGSHVDLLIPSMPGLSIEVGVGQFCRAGETVVARFEA